MWAVLGIAATRDTREIRRAYAKQLKVTNPEDDAEGFQLLRAAYERAMLLAVQVEQADATGQPQAANDEEPTEAARPYVAEVRPAAVPEPTTAAPEPETPAPDPLRPYIAEVRTATQPEAAPTAPAGDDELRIAGELFMKLEVALRGPLPANLSDEVRMLEVLLLSPTMQRLDIHQRAEFALASMFAERIPRTDHLLDTAVRYFTWDKRAHESSLIAPARQVLARMHDVNFIEALRKANDKFTSAYHALMEGRTPRFRWLRASLTQDPHELRLLRELSSNYPNLLRQVPPDTLKWWQDFAGKPRISRPLTITGLAIFVITLIFTVPAFMSDPAAPKFALFIPVFWLLVTAAVVAFKLFVIDTPAHRLRERWGGQPPPKVALGWLPAGIVVMFLAVAVREVPWAGWCVALLGLATWIWANYIAGPPPAASLRVNVLEVRWMQVLLVNIPLLFWLVMSIEEPLGYSAPAGIALTLVLFASGLGRSLQSWMFRMLLDWKLRAASAFAALSLVGVCMAWVANYGHLDSVKPWVIPVVMAVMLLRRSSSFGLVVIHFAIPLITLVAGWGITAVVVERFDLDPTPLEYPGARTTITGALFFLAGAAYSLVREIIEAITRRGGALANP